MIYSNAHLTDTTLKKWRVLFKQSGSKNGLKLKNMYNLTLTNKFTPFITNSLHGSVSVLEKKDCVKCAGSAEEETHGYTVCLRQHLLPLQTARDTQLKKLCHYCRKKKWSVAGFIQIVLRKKNIHRIKLSEWYIQN